TPPVVRQFIYDGQNILLEFVDSDGAGANQPVLDTRYLHGAGVDQVLAQESAGNVEWHLTDHLGTVRDLVNNSGAVVNHFVYDSFGQVISESNPAVDTRYLFTGREFDQEIGLYYYRARYYDANTGRFLSEDPIGFAGGDIHLYRYVFNIPLSITDPTGNVAFVIPVGVAVAEALAAAAAAAAPYVAAAGIGIGLGILLNEANNDQGNTNEGTQENTSGGSCSVPERPYAGQTPQDKPGDFTPIKGTPGKKSDDGSVWEKDFSRHGGSEWKRWKNTKDWEKGKQPESVRPDGSVR
ncbi:MAG: RHS repeat domain-containing protein, partial [Dolichospermum sp.]